MIPNKPDGMIMLRWGEGQRRNFFSAPSALANRLQDNGTVSSMSSLNRSGIAQQKLLSSEMFWIKSIRADLSMGFMCPDPNALKR